MNKAQVHLVDENSFEVEDCVIVGDWINVQLSGGKFSIPASQIAIIEWKNATTED